MTIHRQVTLAAAAAAVCVATAMSPAAAAGIIRHGAPSG
jgi:hypothetical protein